MSDRFLVRVQPLISLSRFNADDFPGWGSIYTKVAPPVLRTYAEPRPALCRLSRRAASVVAPVYSDPSAHRAM